MAQLGALCISNLCATKPSGSKNIDLGLTPSIQNLIEQRKWRDLDEVNKVRNIYNFVRDEVQFGYNTGDTIQASQVLSDGYGQCNTKATLLMALLRAVGVAMRMGLPSIKPYKKAQSKAFGISYRPRIFYIVGSKFM